PLRQRCAAGPQPFRRDVAGNVFAAGATNQRAERVEIPAPGLAPIGFESSAPSSRSLLMKRTASACFSILLLSIGALLLSLNSCGGNSSTVTTTPPPVGTIQHVVIIFQENRTPDNLFHD